MANNPFENIPDIDFVPKSMDEILKSMIKTYENKYEELTGNAVILPISSEQRIFLNTQALLIYQAYQLIDNGCKMNLTKYSKGKYLDNLALMVGITRLPAQFAVTTVKFTLSALQQTDIFIPKGTRVSTSQNLFFKTISETVITHGTISNTAVIICLESGYKGNAIPIGQINIIVDPVAFVSTVQNLEESGGGSDVENDEQLRLRVYLKPHSFSVAGPEDAYSYFIREYSQAVEGVSIFSPTPGDVDVRITLQDGTLPPSTFIEGLFEFLKDKRPLTDNLKISAPDVTEYSINITYYISKSAAKMKETISQKVKDGVEQYRTWQNSQIGRDISPDTLIKNVIMAGAKRVEICSPIYTLISKQNISKNISVNIEYGGVEDD